MPRKGKQQGQAELIPAGTFPDVPGTGPGGGGPPPSTAGSAQIRAMAYIPEPQGTTTGQAGESRPGELPGSLELTREAGIVLADAINRNSDQMQGLQESIDQLSEFSRELSVSVDALRAAIQEPQEELLHVLSRLREDVLAIVGTMTSAVIEAGQLWWPKALLTSEEKPEARHQAGYLWDKDLPAGKPSQDQEVADAGGVDMCDAVAAGLLG